MGFNSDRKLTTSSMRNSGGEKRELAQISIVKRKNLSKDEERMVAGDRYNTSCIGEKIKDKATTRVSSSTRSSQTENLWNLKYSKGEKEFVGSKTRSPNVKIPHNSPSMKAPECVDNTELFKKTPENYQRSKQALSFGNIYGRFNNAVIVRDHLSENLCPKVNRVECKQMEPFRSNNNHVLGLGGINYGHGSIIKSSINVENQICREEKRICITPIAVANCRDVEEIKNAGNEEYKRGRFLEAISFYDKAIALRPRNAPCHNNKAAALAGLGRYKEAVGECLEAIECDPSYSRAHHRLGSLYARLGRVEDAKWHLKFSGQQLNSESMQKILHLETHLVNMRKARNVENWNRVLTESTLAIDAGADASDQVLAFKAEALLNLHKAKEALELLMVERKSKFVKSRKIPKGDSCILIIEAQIYMYLGRFDDGVIAAECAVKMDCRPESLMWLKKAHAVANARKTGNEFYKAGKYLEACTAYGQGLEHVPTNSVLLSNRAACRSKLGQWGMAVEDCNVALKNRPDYTKALLRRAHSKARLQCWEESLRDYEVLSKEMPGDPNIAQSILQVQLELKKARGGSFYSHFGGQVTHLNSYAQFLKTMKSAGLSLLQFFMKSDDKCKQLSPLINELSQRYPSWNFLKVDVEENPDWAKFECVKYVPIFIIYKDGLKLREICKPDQHILEHALKFHST